MPPFNFLIWYQYLLKISILERRFRIAVTSFFLQLFFGIKFNSLLLQLLMLLTMRKEGNVGNGLAKISKIGCSRIKNDTLKIVN